jgi:hypothetical protein
MRPTPQTILLQKQHEGFTAQSTQEHIKRHMEMNALRRQVLGNLQERNVDYNKTRWGKFFSTYRSLDIQELSRRFKKMTSEMETIMQLPKTTLDEFRKVAQRIYKKAGYSDTTPQMFKKQKKLIRFEEIADGNMLRCRLLYESFITRYNREREEIEQYLNSMESEFKKRKDDLKTRRIENAAEKIQCCKCKKQVRRNHIAQHLSSKFCISSEKTIDLFTDFAENIIPADPDSTVSVNTAWRHFNQWRKESPETQGATPPKKAAFVNFLQSTFTVTDNLMIGYQLA